MESPLTERGLLRAALVLALALFGLFLVWQFLTEIVTVVLVLLVGLLLAVALSGPVEILHRRKVPRPVASISIVAGFLMSFVFGAYLAMPVFTEQIWQLVSTLPFVFSQLDQWFERLATDTGVPIGGNGVASPSTLVTWSRRLLGGALGLFGSLTTLVFGLVISVLVPLYLTASPNSVVGWTVRLFPPASRPRVRTVLSKVRDSLLNWLKGRLLAMAIVGALWTLALYVIGIPGALFLGVLAGFLEFIPYFGPIISTIPPVLLALGGDPVDALWVVLAYFAIQQVQGYLLKPLIEGGLTALNPAVIVVAVSVSGAAFGFLGVLLAVPAAVVTKVLVEELWFRRLEEEPEDQPDER